MNMNKNSLLSALEKIKSDKTGYIQDNIPTKERKNKTVLIGSHFDPRVQKQLKILAAEEDRTHHSLLAEALDLLFMKYGKKQ